MPLSAKEKGSQNIDLQYAVQYLRDEKIIVKDKDIADKMKVGQGTVSNYVNGMAKASPNFRKNFERTFGVNLKDFGKEGNEAAGTAKRTPALDYQTMYWEVVERERKALEDDKAFFKDVLKSSLIAIREDVQAISARQKGTGEVVLHSLERLEKLNKDELVKEADKQILQIDKEVRRRGNEPFADK